MKKYIIYILTGLISIAFIGSSIGFLIPTDLGLEIVKSFHFPIWTRWILGFVELGLGIAIIFPKFRISACIGILLWLIFDVIVHSITEHVEWSIILGFALPVLFLLYLLMNKTKIR